ncbi:MAG TPA: four helix bundle protein [Terriglobia bacterium]|nr:four helix bundle protein [Terriglobia bacterium]
MAGVYKADELKVRSKRFAIAIVRLVRELPRNEEARILGRQLLRSGTSVAANYRAVCRARSKAEFIAKLGVVVEEIDETAFWIELLAESETFPQERLRDIEREANELLAIFAASRNTAKKR